MNLNTLFTSKEYLHVNVLSETIISSIAHRRFVAKNVMFRKEKKIVLYPDYRAGPEAKLRRPDISDFCHCAVLGGVSDSLTRATRDLVLLQADGFHWSLMTQQVQHVPGCCSDGHRCSHKESILTCVFITFRQARI